MIDIEVNYRSERHSGWRKIGMLPGSYSTGALLQRATEIVDEYKHRRITYTEWYGARIKDITDGSIIYIRQTEDGWERP